MNAQNLAGDSLFLSVEGEAPTNPAFDPEGPHVVWYGLCGYDSVTIYTKSAEAAQALFAALQQVYATEED